MILAREKLKYALFALNLFNKIRTCFNFFAAMVFMTPRIIITHQFRKTGKGNKTYISVFVLFRETLFLCLVIYYTAAPTKGWPQHVKGPLRPFPSLSLRR